MNNHFEFKQRISKLVNFCTPDNPILLIIYLFVAYCRLRNERAHFLLRFSRKFFVKKKSHKILYRPIPVSISFNNLFVVRYDRWALRVYRSHSLTSAIYETSYASHIYSERFRHKYFFFVLRQYWHYFLINC